MLSVVQCVQKLSTRLPRSVDNHVLGHGAQFRLIVRPRQ